MKDRWNKNLWLRLQAVVMCAILSISILTGQSAFALDEQNQTGNADIVRGAALSYQKKGETGFTELTAPYRINDITKVDQFHAAFSFYLVDHQDAVTGAISRTVAPGDYYYVDLPENLVVSNPASGSILGNLNRPIANYIFEEQSTNNWRVKITFTDYVSDPNEEQIHGQLDMDFSLDLSSIGVGTTTTVYIPIDNNSNIELEITNPTPPPTKPISLEKTVSSYDQLTRTLIWNVKLSPDTGIFGGCVFTDTLDPNTSLKSMKHGAVLLQEGTDYTYNRSTGEIVYSIPAGRDGANFQNITITTEVKREVYGSTLAVDIRNQAHLSGGEQLVDLDSNTATKTITPDWLKKSGTVFEGNKIQWTLTANTTRQEMYNAVITDHLQADVLLDKTSVKVNGNAITVYDGSHTTANPNEIYGVYLAQADGKADLKIYLQRENASNATQTVTFITNIVSPDQVVTADPVYNNWATLEANYKTGDGTGEGTLPVLDLDQVGVAVPYVSVVKNAVFNSDNKRKGTITWNISAVSNLSDYGYSKIVDTLPADQDYLADEIYWGNQQLNTTTEPSAEISADGRTLTIIFHSDRKLQTTQNFTVTTKIKPEIYGQNLNQREFNNAVRAVLLKTGDPDTKLEEAANNCKVQVTNTVISKTAGSYTQNTTKQGQNPRVNFTITVNSNLMPLNNLVVTDDLNQIVTQFKKSGTNSYVTVSGVQWGLVPDSLVIQRKAGSLDTGLDLAAIAANAVYAGNVLTVYFGSGVQVNDQYTISFTAELDIAQQDIFKENGTIRCNGNVGGIEAIGLKTGVISTAGTGNVEIKNEVLGKQGTQLVNEQQIRWSIHLNQHRLNLDSTQVTDTLPLGLTLDPTSVKLYTNVIGADGNFIADSQLETQGMPVPFTYSYRSSTVPGEEGRYVLVVDLSSATTDYVLSFATDVNRNLLGKTISNSAYFMGQTAAPEETNTGTMKLSDSSGGWSVTKAPVTVHKRSKDNSALVDTAYFSLYWLRNGDPNDPVFVRTLPTSGGSVTFYGLSREQQYRIVETGAPDGYLLDSSNPVNISVPAAGAGNPEDVYFYNTPIKTGAWMPSALKKLDGKSIVHPFQFEINDGMKALMTGTTQNVMANGDAPVTFVLNGGVSAGEVLQFTDAHTFSDSDPAGTTYLAATKTLYMREIPSSWSGYEFDSTVYTLVIKAYNVKGQSQLKVVAEDENGNLLTDAAGNFTAAGVPVFQNRFRANGSIQLSAEKIVIGHAVEAGQFSFELYEGNQLLQTVQNGAGAETAANTYTANVLFAPISYQQGDVGIKTYRIVEKNNALPGYTYDAAEYTVQVRITDQDNANLGVAVEQIQKTLLGNTTAASKVQFVNTYTTGNCPVTLHAQKTLSGRVLASSQFIFVLAETDSAGTVLREVGQVSNDGAQIALPTLTYTQSDIGKSFYYQVSEKNLHQPGYTYDDTVYRVQLTISDQNNGTLKAVTAMKKGDAAVSAMQFDNQYHADGAITLEGNKILSGKALPANQFSFALQQLDSTGLPAGNAVLTRNTADGKIVFPMLHYTEADAGKTFLYQVTEVHEQVGGYTYDPTAFQVSVRVEDRGDGTLDVQKTIMAPAAASAITFSNAYTAADTGLQLVARKVLNGRLLQDQQFTFVLNHVNEDGTLIRKLQETKNSLDGSVTFDELIYTQADMGKTFYYTVSEKKDSLAGYGYDESLYRIQVEIVDNNNGTLTAKKTITKDNAIEPSLLFTNSYTTTDTSLQLGAFKVLNGRTLAEHQFRFQLFRAGIGAESAQLVEEAFNDDGGNILFTPITYTQADMGKTYLYTLKEVNDRQPGYQYDQTVYGIRVEIIDQGDGTLRKQITLYNLDTPEQSLSEPVFQNTYTATGSVALHAGKKLSGAVLQDQQFSFALADDQGNILQTVRNKADGSVLFQALSFNQDQLGTHAYRVYELSENQKDILFDSTIYDVSVFVEDHGDGTLLVSTSYQKEQSGQVSNVDTMEFLNQYQLQKGTSPFTGDHPYGILFGVLSAFSLLLALFMRKKKRFGSR